MPEQFELTSLWRRTLGKQPTPDLFEHQREKLRSAYFTMRHNAEVLVSTIPQDCQGLTVHNITHLDALWDTASLIAGEEFVINPAEAFVFGASVLLHDAGMCVAAFPNGMEDITKTAEWSDIVHSTYRRNGLERPEVDQIKDPVPQLKSQILFETLRVLHALQAEKLISVRWRHPSTGEELALLEDTQLRGAFGAAIGRISHSHNWDIGKLRETLRTATGSATELPPEWSVNEVKVACLLRCADAGQIDHRRAPALLYSITQPKGYSDLHWRFQTKLNRPIIQDNYLIYTSGQHFAINESKAWWLCYDTIKMIDRELSSSSALLQDIGSAKFAATRVYGAEAPEILASRILTDGWKPVDAEIKVSNPVQLAETLGGRHLYGSGFYAPIRELLQNAVDAVRMRRQFEGRSPEWGSCSLTLELDSHGKRWLHVDDNGVGMTERVLTGPLVDFGKSIWNSSLLQAEFPGLESLGVKPVGKFGIGFFSIFLLGSNVKVITKPFRGAMQDCRVLEFDSLVSRPLIRPAHPDELPIDCSTRISVAIDKPDLSQVDNADFQSRQSPLYIAARQRRKDIHDVLAIDVKRLVACVDVEIKVNDKENGQSYIHRSDWKTVTTAEFLSEIAPDKPVAFHLIHTDTMSLLQSEAGEVYGRASLPLFNEKPNSNRYVTAAFTSVEGFTYPADRFYEGHGGYVGVFSGATDDVSRNLAYNTVPDTVLSKWATEQASKIAVKKFQVHELVHFCHTILQLGGNSMSLPFCIRGGLPATFHEFELYVENNAEILCPLVTDYKDSLKFRGLSDMSARTALNRINPAAVYFEPGDNSDAFNEDQSRILRQSEPTPIDISDIKQMPFGLDQAIRMIRLKWDDKFRASIVLDRLLDKEYINASKTHWFLSLQRQ